MVTNAIGEVVCIYCHPIDETCQSIQREIDECPITNRAQCFWKQARERRNSRSCARSQHHAHEVAARNLGRWCGSRFHP